MTTNRRIFMGRCGAAGAISVGAGLPGIWRGAISAAGLQGKPDTRGRVLVVVEMAGGNDGLNTVIPFTDDAYYKARPVLAVAKDRALKVNGQLAFHPKLSELHDLYSKGQVAVIQGVGYPKPDRSHFRSMDIWHTARPESVDLRDGWLGRALERDPKSLAGGMSALALGSEKLPLALLSGRVNVPNVQSMDKYRLLPAPGDKETQDFARKSLREAVAFRSETASPSGSELDFLRRTADVTLTSVDRLGEVTKAYKPGATYPETGLAQKLQVVAKLIAGDLGTQIFYVSLGGFDTHSRQQPVHELLLAELSGAVGAFLKDLKSHGLADRVMVATFSEFGRRVAENGSLGTDHGAASQMFCIGSGVKSGIVGKHPSLTDLEDGDLKHHTDFRCVYAALLEKWLNYPAEPVLGKGFQPVDCVRV